ncbi:tetratricopeptide repeat-containing sensor histidine kinase [Lutibacter sp.]
MRKIYFILFYFGFLISVFGQDISNLKKELQYKLSDTARVSLNLKIANVYFSNDNDSSFYYYEQALELAKKIEFEPQIAEITYKFGVFYEDASNYEKAIQNYKAAALIFEKLHNKNKIAKIYNYLGYCYMQLYAQDKAIEYYLKSLNINKEIASQNGEAINYLNIGNLFYAQENYSFAKKYFKDGLEVFKKIESDEGIAASYTNLGNVTADSGNNFVGLEYYKKSIDIQKKLEDDYGIAINYNNIGDCYIKLKEFEEALNYFSKSLKIAENLQEKMLTSIVLLNISDVNIQKKQFIKGIYNAKKSLHISQQIGDLDIQSASLKLLSSAYESLGNIVKAYGFNKKYVTIKDSLITMDKTNKVKLFQALHELEYTHTAIDKLSAENELTQSKYEAGRKFTYFLIGSMVLFSFFVVVLLLQQTSKKKAYNLLEYKNYLINKMNNEIQTQRDNLKQLNNTKDRFFSIIAHDLKNPFNSIIGFTELLIENGNEYDEEKRLKFLKIIKGSTSKASSLLNNLLIWANSQSGSLKFNPQKIELKQNVSNVVSLLEIQAINKEIKISNSISKNLFVEADKNMLATILRNLISNSIKFTEIKGEVQITALTNSNFVEITVKDNGIGISKTEIDNLFKIEVKNSNIGTANEQGSGLGLILCKEFVDKHGGKIWVESTLNEGSEFKFTILLK